MVIKYIEKFQLRLNCKFKTVKKYQYLAYPLMPIGVFKNSKCQISIYLCDYEQSDINQLLPAGHTCSFELHLPPYSQQEFQLQSYSLLQQKVKQHFH
ncbi:unnamed protein product [Paramecium octaurelia]|uniref:Uncharacterized protein n=1 Tax=Paramecium octaurelia TaxID=43137 RepID=A0A8S1RZH5_PAROT|nr:unnamed protein product [Paramecium octaurelia]